MCFAPQWRPLFRPVNLQTCFDPGVLCTFWLCLAPQRRALFNDISTSKSALNVRCCFVHFDFECASRHNRVQLLIPHLARWLRTCRFSEPTFRPSGATNHWKKHGDSRLVYLCIFFLLTLSLLWSCLFFSSPLWLFPPLLAHLSIWSEDVGSLSSKLPSIKRVCLKLWTLRWSEHWTFLSYSKKAPAVDGTVWGDLEPYAGGPLRFAGGDMVRPRVPSIGMQHRPDI